VVENFQKLANGTDVQLEAGVTEILRLLNNTKRFIKPDRPEYEDRN
jgi:tricorn protease